MPITTDQEVGITAADLQPDNVPANEEQSNRQIVPTTGGIPQIHMSPREEDELIRFLDQELHLAEGERSDFMKDLARWQEVYRAAPEQGPKNFPIRNSANLTIPVVKEVVNILTAQLVQTALTNRPYWIVDALAAEWEPFIHDVEEFIDIAAERDLEFSETAIPWILESVKYGTSVLQIDHLTDVRKSFVYNRAGTKVFEKSITRHDGPKAHSIALEDFWIRLFENDIQDARWVAKRMRMSEQTLWDRVATGKFSREAVERVVGHPEARNDPSGTDFDRNIGVVQEARERSANQEPIGRQSFEIFEFWVSWDTDNDDRFEETQIYYHRDSRTILAKRYMPYWHGRRPFVKMVYFPVEHQFYGEGVCAQVEEFQEEISLIHNQRMDNATLANLKMIIKRKMAQGLRPGDPLYSGKIIEVADIHNDIREFELSEIYPSTVQNEQITRTYVERVSGVSEAQFSARPVSRTTATAQLALLQEQSRRFDLTVRDIRRAISEIGHLTLGLYYQYGTNGKAIAWLGERGRVVEAVFRLPHRVVEVGVGIRASAPTSQLNKEARRQSSLAIFNLLNTMYERLLQVVGAVSPQAVGVIAHDLVKSAHKFMHRTLEDFDVADPDEVLSALHVLEKVLPAPEDMGGLSDFEQREETLTVLDQLSRLEDLIQQVGRTEEGRDRVLRALQDSERVSREEGVQGRGGPDSGPGEGPTRGFGRGDRNGARSQGGRTGF